MFQKYPMPNYSSEFFHFRSKYSGLNVLNTHLLHACMENSVWKLPRPNTTGLAITMDYGYLTDANPSSLVTRNVTY